MEEGQIKFTDEELQRFADLQAKYQKNVVKMGQLQLKKYMIDDEIAKLKEDESNVKKEYVELQSEEDSLLNDINKKYGEGNLDPKTGIFTPVKK